MRNFFEWILKDVHGRAYEEIDVKIIFIQKCQILEKSHKETLKKFPK